MSELNIHHISKSFGDVTVLQDINLTVSPGDFVTLLGPSGCGKTTLLRIIAGLETPDTGTIEYGEESMVDAAQGFFASPQDRGLGYVFQDYGLWPHLTVADNVAFPLKMIKMAKPEIDKRVLEVLGNVKLTEHAGKLPEQLSGGQKQRVSIARALAGKPKMILFDEPLSNLDANLREELGQEIRLLSKQLGLTCINVTHDRREAQILSDYIALMKDGVFHQYGKPEDLFRAPLDVWAAQFLDTGNILPACKIRGDGQGEAEGETEHVLVPRGALKVAETINGLSANVLNCIFIEERYEITADLDGTLIKLYGHQPVKIHDQIGVTVDENHVLSL